MFKISICQILIFLTFEVKNMKTCPRCGSALADNEPYCENCGYDPDFDGDEWED